MSHESLLIMNLLVWFAPLFFYRGLVFLIVLVVNAIFSASYWIYILVCDLLRVNYGSSVVWEHVDTSLFYSVCAGISINCALLLGPRRIDINRNGFLLRLENFINSIPGRNLAPIAKIFFFCLLIYCYIEAINQIGFGDRIYFNSNLFFWNVTLLPLLAVFLSAILIWEYQNSKFKNLPINILVILYLFVFLVGFDGGRRSSGLLIVTFFVLSAFVWMRRGSNRVPLILHLMALNLLATFLSYGRNFLVGWSILIEIFNSDFDIFNLLKYFTLGIFAPMPTVHVNTHMIDYVDLHGTQGYSNYLSAMLNTIFPKFIFQEYLFGEPLVRRIGYEMGWFGFDFGFMAEAIYSGGLFAVILVHFILGIFMAYILRRLKFGSNFAALMLVALFIALVNSLRSDFMNFLKMFLYPFAFLYLISILKRFRIR